MKHRPATRIVPALSLLILLAVWLGVPSAALAHAKLSGSNPVAGATLSTSPGKVDLQFTESVSLQFTTIKLLNRARQELQVGPPALVGSNNMEVTAGLPASLPDGTYTVVWRTLSATDGHITTGNFAFRVVSTGAGAGVDTTGAQPIASPEPDSTLPGSTDVEGTSENPDPLRWIIRAVMLASAALLAGGSIFSGLILRPLLSGDGQNAALVPVLRRRFGIVGTIAAALLLVSLLLDMVLQIGSITGTGLFDGLSNLGLSSTLLTTTGYGYAWFVKVIAATVLLATMPAWWRGANRSTEQQRGIAPFAWSLAGAAGITLALGEALSSHAAAEGSSTAVASDGSVRLYSSFLSLPLLSDWAHLAAAFTWIGGVAYMALVLYPTFRSVGMQGAEQRAFLARAVPRFSRLAVGSVVLLGTTGLYNIIVRTTDIGAILSSFYGQVLAAKIVLFIFLVGLGAINLLKLTPELRGQTAKSTPASDPSRGLRRSVRIEIVLACGAFLCAAGLSLLPPPSSAGTAYAGTLGTSAPGTGTPQATPVAEESPTPTAPLTSTAQVSVGGYDVTLYTNSSLDGDVFTATLARIDPAAPPLTDVEKVILSVTPQDMDAGTSSITTTLQSKAGAGNEVWRAEDTIFTLDGGYLVTVIAQRTQSNDLKAAFRYDLAEDTGLKERPSQVVEVHLDTDPSPPISGTAILKIALVDGTDAPISGATIAVHPLMPAHGHVEPTDVAKPVPGQPGQYTMPVHFTMGGAWLIVFDVTIPGQDPIRTDAGLDIIGPEVPGPEPTSSP